MKKMVLSIVLVLIILIVGAASYVKFVLPQIPLLSDIKVDVTPERIKRGEYLTNHVTLCMDCHSTRDWSKFSGPLTPGTLGRGGEYFDEKVDMPGHFYSKNITPFSLENWTDAEIFRAITSGENKDGIALFPLMPYLYYGTMDKEDIYDIIAYIRSLPSIDSQIPKRSLNFPMNFIVNTFPKKAQLSIKPSKSDTIRYGAYLTNASACIECHTQVKKGQIIPELAFAGGREFLGPNGISISANITPDTNTGIGKWSAANFVQRFKAYQNLDSLPIMDKNEINTVMPWYMFSGMEESDLIAIYKYLHTLKPIEHSVNHFKPLDETAQVK
ncbi:MAG: c-type cytochrome [Gelidibacter sp.]|uniref:c-type cytochrome n=1 Tax=Gelidibacter sp. TaxID=2018083 RepID=UPI003266AFBC